MIKNGKTILLSRFIDTCAIFQLRKMEEGYGLKFKNLFSEI